jgi:hypothetical protein
MEPEQFRSLAIEIYGKWGHQRHMAREHKVAQTIVRRWCLGQLPIPQEVVARLRKDAAKKLGAVGDLLA